MSVTLIMMIITIVVVLLMLIICWKRDFIIVNTCPREILFVESAEERYRLYARGLKGFCRNTRIALITYIVAFFVLSLAIDAVIIAVTQGGKWSVTGMKLTAIVSLVIPLTVVPLRYARYRKWMRVYLRQYLNDHGIPICENCGYDLRGQVDPRCPECGTAFDGKNAVDDKGQ